MHRGSVRAKFLRSRYFYKIEIISKVIKKYITPLDSCFFYSESSIFYEIDKKMI